MANPPIQTPVEQKPWLNMADFAAWRVKQQDYTVEFYYLNVPRHVRWIGGAVKWLQSTLDGRFAQVLEWCESRKTRVVWPSGTWGKDIGG